MITPDQVKKEKALLGITENENDALVQFALESAEEIIKNYCHIDGVPEGLNTTTSFGGMESEFTKGLLKDYDMALRQYRRVVFR